MTLTTDDFIAFYTEVHDQTPFPWQRDLVKHVMDQGAWPSLIDVPTGLGKTALLDVAVFVTALTAGDTGPGRLGRRRTFFVVDRRIIVDQAHARALQIAHTLRMPPIGSVSESVSQRLASLASRPTDAGPNRGADDSQPLHVVRMRGGATWDANWLAQPDHVGIVTGTIDQVGSRLFFRGYGVSPRRWPIDAALVGTDSLILLDEAHLSTPLVSALKSARRHDQPTDPLSVPRPAVVQLTATSNTTAGGSPGNANSTDRSNGSKFDADHVFVLDVDAHLGHEAPIARRRLLAGKQLTLQQSAKGTIVRDLAERAAQHAQQDGAAAARVLVVCNTVDRARAVHALLARSLPETCDLDLLIGRSRELDRAPLVARVLTRFGADAKPGQRPAVLVATQTVEVGVDLDATALVTECASIDALVQRIGRVNRRGDLTTSPVEVLDAGSSDSPVYGAAKDATWSFLQGRTNGAAGIDVSPVALRALRSQVPRDCFVQPQPPPLLLPAHLEAWSRTAPAPSNDSPIEAYLHGLDAGPAGVSLVWRDGLRADGGLVSVQAATSQLTDLPPRSTETVEVPLSAVLRWLSGLKPAPVSDWDADDDWDDVAFDDTVTEQVLAHRSDSEGQMLWRPVPPSQVRPGDVLVVPAELGGLDEFGWAPDSTEHVIDLGELAALRAGRGLLRIDSRLAHRMGMPALPEAVESMIHSVCTTDEPAGFETATAAIRSAVRSWLTSGPPSDTSKWERRDLEDLAVALTGSRLETEPEPVTLKTVSSATRTSGFHDGVEDGTVNADRRVTLDVHHRRVGARAAEIAASLGLRPGLAAAVTNAARWHDLGKLDPRFQAMLFGGDVVAAAVASDPLAKSGTDASAWAERRRAKRLSGLPTGARHEAWSAALVASLVEKTDATEVGHPELVIHLVSSHHGHGRPLLPPVQDDATHDLHAHVDGRDLRAELPRYVDLEAAERFHQLNRRYGHWGLALLETILRCADMTISGEGS